MKTVKETAQTLRDRAAAFLAVEDESAKVKRAIRFLDLLDTLELKTDTELQLIMVTTEDAQLFATAAALLTRLDRKEAQKFDAPMWHSLQVHRHLAFIKEF